MNWRTWLLARFRATPMPDEPMAVEPEVQPDSKPDTPAPKSPEQAAVDREFERFQRTRRRLQDRGEWYNDPEQPQPKRED